MGTASVFMLLGQFAVDADGLSGEELSLFDPAIYFYDYYLMSMDGRLYFGAKPFPAPDSGILLLDETQFFYRQ